MDFCTGKRCMFVCLFVLEVCVFFGNELFHLNGILVKRSPMDSWWREVQWTPGAKMLDVVHLVQ